jgi:hypothetical protein
MTRPLLSAVACLTATTVGAASPEVMVRHHELAKCVAFYTWESKTADGNTAVDSLQRAAGRVRARLVKELGSELGNAMADSAIHTWDYMSSVVSDAEWLRIKGVLHSSCLEWE